MRLLAAIVLVAAGIRLTFELLEPVWPYMSALLVICAIWRIRRWWLERW